MEGFGSFKVVTHLIHVVDFSTLYARKVQNINSCAKRTFLLLLSVALVGGWPTGRPRFGLKMVAVECCWEVFVVGFEVLFGWEVFVSTAGALVVITV